MVAQPPLDDMQTRKTSPGLSPREAGQSQQDRQQDRSPGPRLPKRSVTEPDYPEVQAPKRINLDGKPVTERPAVYKSPGDVRPVPLPGSMTCSPHPAEAALPPSRNVPAPESPVHGPITPGSAQASRAFFAGAAHQLTLARSSSPLSANADDPHYRQSSTYASASQSIAPSPYMPSTSYSAAALHTLSASNPGMLPHAVPPPYSAAYAPPMGHLSPNAAMSVAYVPGSFVAGVPFQGLPLHHQNFILTAATHCWKDQYAELQLDNNSLRASLAATKDEQKSMEDRVQLLEARLIALRSRRPGVAANDA